MTDPFQPKLSAHLLPIVGFLLIVGVLIFAASMTVLNTAEPEGMMIEARVVGVGSRPTSMTGDEPVLKVRLQDGTTHTVLGSRAEATKCNLGSRISLVRRGAGLRIGMRGCRLR
jgi:hypothetical protein